MELPLGSSIYYMKYILCNLFFFSCLLSYSQGENSIWYSAGYGLRFTDTTIDVLKDSEFTWSNECFSTMASPAGDLLFYSNGERVYDRTHSLMPNGNGLTGGNSTTQSILIMNRPGFDNEYYCFTNTDLLDPIGQISFSIVDLSLNNGLGAVVPASKNTPVFSNTTEKMIGFSNSCTSWILTHERINNAYVSIPVTSQGIGMPIISSVGLPHIGTGQYSGSSPQGQMTISPDGSMVSTCVLYEFVELTQFDSDSGVFSDPISIPLPRSNDIVSRAYSSVFTEDGSFLYTAETIENLNDQSFEIEIYRYNLSIWDEASIIGSKEFISTISNDRPNNVSLALTPLNTIILTRGTSDYLGQIFDITSVNPQYEDESILIGPFEPRIAGLHNPVVINNYELEEHFDTLLLCGNDSILIGDNLIVKDTILTDTINVNIGCDSIVNTVYQFSEPLPSDTVEVILSVTNPLFTTPMDTYSSEGTFIESYLNDQECDSTIIIIVSEDGSLINQDISLPNVFTPNNDGINDDLSFSLPDTLEIRSLSVYNRWGNVLYSSNSIYSWDGTVNNTPVNPGVYVYLLEVYDTIEDRPTSLSASVTLIK